MELIVNEVELKKIQREAQKQEKLKKEGKKVDAEEEPVEEKPVVICRTTTDIQKRKLDKLMSDMNKEAYIPEPRKEWKPREAPEFVRHVMGSSAGAGSGEFHVYRGIRKRENKRQEYLDRKSMKDELDDEFHSKVEDNNRNAEEATAKKRAKRRQWQAQNSFGNSTSDEEEVNDNIFLNDISSQASTHAYDGIDSPHFLARVHESFQAHQPPYYLQDYHQRQHASTSSQNQPNSIVSSCPMPLNNSLPTSSRQMLDDTTPCDSHARKRGWEDNEVYALIELWKAEYDKLKRSTSNKKKTDIYRHMHESLIQKLPRSHFTLMQMKTKIRNLEIKYKEKKRMCVSTGEEGYREIIEDFPFYENVDTFLGKRDSNNPSLMKIVSSSNTNDDTNDEPPHAPKGKKQKKGDDDTVLIDIIREQIDREDVFTNQIVRELRETREQMLDACNQQTKTLLDGLRDIFK